MKHVIAGITDEQNISTRAANRPRHLEPIGGSLAFDLALPEHIMPGLICEEQPYRSIQKVGVQAKGMYIVSATHEYENMSKNTRGAEQREQLQVQQQLIMSIDGINTVTKNRLTMTTKLV